LALLASGLSEKEVASQLALSPATVHDYVKALHRRLGARSRSELLARARTTARYPRLSTSTWWSPALH
jgi:DNA-binding NarL/FixJ family response regulator